MTLRQLNAFLMVSCPLLSALQIIRACLVCLTETNPSSPFPQAPSHSGARSPRRRIGPRPSPRTPSLPLLAPMSLLRTTTGSLAAVVPMLPVVVVAPPSVVDVVLPEVDLLPLLPTVPAPRTPSRFLFPPTSPTPGTPPRTTMMVAGVLPLLPPRGNLLLLPPTLLRLLPLLLLTHPSPQSPLSSLKEPQRPGPACCVNLSCPPNLLLSLPRSPPRLNPRLSSSLSPPPPILPQLLPPSLSPSPSTSPNSLPSLRPSTPRTTLW